MKKLLFIIGLLFSFNIVFAQFKKLDRYLNISQLISQHRTDSLLTIVDKIHTSDTKNVVFVSISNSNMNIVYQLFFQVYVSKFDLDLNVYSYTENTQILSNLSKSIIDSLSHIGFRINKLNNSKYLVSYDWTKNSILIFPKKSDNFQIPNLYLTIKVDEEANIQSIASDMFFIVDRLSKLKYSENLFSKK